MQLTSLSISGFKSFAIDTKIEFAEGITVVVGPNGCGKSNVVDSLRWVLGEQRSSVLRGDRMENVIFNGTNQRKPLNLADVRLVVNNESGRINLPYTEIEIARKLHRDGTSDYMINGNVCRLRDITDMLHDSGMGPNLYSILELKMVESILRDEGEGRRQLFEEASGIAKYKQRRRQALSKLGQTEDDLLRLADIVYEVERQVASLKRQVSKARRYKEYTAKLRTMESALMFRQYQSLRKELTPLETAMKESSDSSESLRSTLRSEEAALEELKRQLVESEQSTSHFRKRLEEIVSGISTLEAEQAGHRATVQAAHETIERTDRQRILANEKRETLERRRRDQELQREGLNGELELAEQALRAAQENVDRLSVLLMERESELSAHAQKIHDIREDLSRTESLRTDELARRASIIGKRESALSAMETIAREREQISERVNELSEQQESARQIEAEANSHTMKCREELQASINRRDEMIEEVRELKNVEHSTQASLDLLTTLETKGPRASAPIKALQDTQIAGLMSLLGDAVTVEEKYRRALQAVLGSAAYYYLADNSKTALMAIDHLKSEGSGRVTLIPVESFKSADRGEFSLPKNALCRAMDLIKNKEYDVILRHFLDGIVIVKDWSIAQNLAEWARDNDCTVVTLEGDWINAYGMIYSGSPEANGPVDLGLIEQRKELIESLHGIQIRLKSTNSQISTLTDEITSRQEALNAGESRLDDARKELFSLREQEVGLSTLSESLDNRDSDAQKLVRECDIQVEQIKQKIDVTEAEIADFNDHLIREEQSREEYTERVAFSRSELNSERDQLHQRERSRDAVKHRLLLLDAELERIDSFLQDMTESQAANEQAAERAVNDIVRLNARLDEISADLTDKFRRRDERKLEVDVASRKLDSIRGKISDQDSTLRKLRSGQDDVIAGERKLSMDVARLQGELEALLVNARNQYNLDPAAPDFLERYPELAEIEADPEWVQDIKQKIENMGPVNLLAVEEFEQENTRLEGMLKNREDLLQAKSTLEETIRKINETAEAKFLHTFEAVRANFQKLFLEFFPAGEADLILSGKDLLEADITMWANPSGKRLKSLNLMSGGEKTMTAIALLFSLYRVKPSPFCVLDEVDAPLDDTNIDRFTHMLRHHTDETQFILITHNKRTMEIGDNLYGVTMQEEGVSKLVSVRLLRESEPSEMAPLETSQSVT